MSDQRVKKLPRHELFQNKELNMASQANSTEVIKQNNKTKLYYNLIDVIFNKSILLFFEHLKAHKQHSQQHVFHSILKILIKNEKPFLQRVKSLTEKQTIGFLLPNRKGICLSEQFKKSIENYRETLFCFFYNKVTLTQYTSSLLPQRSHELIPQHRVLISVDKHFSECLHQGYNDKPVVNLVS